jgi:hypothetical protein
MAVEGKQSRPMNKRTVPGSTMHRVVQSHLVDFKRRFGITRPDDKSFEAFVNYSVLRSYSEDQVAPEDLIYDGDDPGIDGVMFFVDGAYISSVDELEDELNKSRRDVEIIVAFVESKTSERWDKTKINAFDSAVMEFIDEETAYPISSYLAERKELFNEVIKNVGRIRDGKPRIHAYFATTAREPGPNEREIRGAFRALQKSLTDTGYFAEIAVRPLDRDRLVSLWGKADGPVEAQLPVFAIAPFPKSPGVEESYVVTSKAKDFIERLLIDDSQNLRQRVFEENVRDFIGLDSEVNAEILGTLSDPEKQKRFGILNNGITIVSPDVRVQGNEIYLRGFQIVNGCQTSNLLYEDRALISPDVTVMLKIIETADGTIVDDIVRSTNRQTKVQDDQFLATLDTVKGIERYFNARGVDEEHRLFFERRKHQFSNQEIPAVRVFDIRELARCTGAEAYAVVPGSRLIRGKPAV